MARVVAVGTRHPVPGDGAEDELRVRDAQVVEPHPAPGQRAGPHGLDDDVGIGSELLEDGDARIGAQVEHQRPLAAVEVEVHERGPLDDGPRHLADVVTGRGFHLDHVRAEVDQGRGDGGRPEGRALDDPHTVQRWRRRHRTSGCRRPDRSGRRPRAPGGGPRHTGAVETDALDDALTVFAGTAPGYGSLGLANHGPMVAEALVHLGQADAVAGWVARYRVRLDEAPPPAARPLTEEDWPAALGQAGRYPEWLALFEREVADRPAPAVVGEWAPRLLPGAIGAATHGLIRTGHAVRALSAADTPPRRLELAIALAFWASSYHELPGPPLLIGHERVPEALADLPYLPEEAPRRVLISDRVASVVDIADEFEQAVASLGWTGGAAGAAGPVGGRWVSGLPSQRGRRRSDRPPARRHVAPGLRDAAALDGPGGPRRRSRLRLAGRGGVARGVRRGPGRPGLGRGRPFRRRARRPRRWNRATSTR